MKPQEIKRLREALGHTQSEFAEKVGLGPKGTTVSKWEAGTHRPHPIFVEQMKKIAKESK